ncbi:uncharacterized protein [Garra rufa]|uniref:uncharacterized protein n=1 Tax=Garra rufa TaxID=137080 RepID=UPI003CCED966
MAIVTGQMALGEIYCTIDISKTRRFSKTGFLFFLLLQMSLLSKVWSENTTDSPTTTLPTVTMSSTMSEPASQSSTTMNPGSVSSATSDPSSTMATLGSTVTETLVTSTQSTAINTATTPTLTGNSTDTVNTSSETYPALSCPAFDCTTDCYTQFMNMTAKSCNSSKYFCQIMKQDAGYSVSCSASCGVSCGNATLSNCSVNCCNTTNCLNNTLLGMFSSVSTTVATTTSTTTSTTIKATVTTTQASNGKKCHNIKCTGAACYKSFTAASNAVMCPVGQDYCMLQKISATTESWQAGCSIDCRKMTACTSTSTSSSTTACCLECCNATTTASCLKLTGDVNMPSSATRGLHCPTLLTASLLLLWIVKVFT